MTHPPIPSTLEETTGDNEPFYWWGVSSLEWLAAARARDPERGRLSASSRETCGFWAPHTIRSTRRGCDSWPPWVTRRLRSTATTWRPTPGSPRFPGSTRSTERGEWLFYRANDQLVAAARRLRSNKFWLEAATIRNRARPRRDAGSPGPGRSKKTRSSMESIGRSWPGATTRGGLLSPPQPALYQHVFGPGIPAYTIRTPGPPGLLSPGRARSAVTVPARRSTTGSSRTSRSASPRSRRAGPR